MRRIAFLDIDGCCNSTQWRHGLRDGRTSRPTVIVDGLEARPALQRELIEKLNALVRPDVEWVLSSTWRLDGSSGPRRQVESMLRQLGWQGRLIASTPAASWSPSGSAKTDYSRCAQPGRGVEIKRWLDANGVGPADKVVIIDDDDDLDPLMAYAVFVDGTIGLTDANIERALELLELTR